jgi:hypothetical protein
MRAIVMLAGLVAVIVASNVDVAQGRPGTAIGCMQLSNLKSVFPAGRVVGFTERLQIKVEPARQPVWPGRCGAFWTTYRGDGKTVDVAVTLYETSKDEGAALAEPRMGAVHALSTGARVRTRGPSSGSVGGTTASSTGVVSAFRNLFIVSTSISTSMTPVLVSVQLRIHRLIENTFARLHATH